MVADAMINGMMAQQAPEEAGRGTDTVMAHMSLGEVVIPRALLDDPEVMNILQQIFAAYEIDMREFTVGDPANKINPETGYPEFFLKKIRKAIKKVVSSPIGKIALAAALPFAAPVIGAGLGLSGLAGSIAGGSLYGAGAGLAGGGGLKSALKGGVTGGIGGGLASGLGTAAGTSLAKTSGNALMQGPTQGTGIVGAITRGLGDVAPKITSGIANIKTSTIPSSIDPMSIYSGIQQAGTQEKMKDQLMAAQGRAEAAYAPYGQLGLEAQRELSQRLEQGFDPSALENDAGYQFRLREGQAALDRSLAAQGLGQSGAALKAASEYGQSAASQQYQQAYQDWLDRNRQLAGVAGTGYDAAGSLSNIYGNQGDIKANATAARSNIFNQTLSNVLGRKIVGYDQNGNPIYA